MTPSEKATNKLAAMAAQVIACRMGLRLVARSTMGAAIAFLDWSDSRTN